MPQRIQRKRSKGWRMPEGAVYVGRPTKWGNPFAVTYCDGVHVPGRHWHTYRTPYRILHGTYETKLAAVQAAIESFRHTVFNWLGGAVRPYEIRSELRGKDLVCWCPLDQPCHADVLLEIANGSAS